METDNTQKEIINEFKEALDDLKDNKFIEC